MQVDLGIIQHIFDRAGVSLLKIADICSVVFYNFFITLCYVLTLPRANFSVKIVLLMLFTLYNIAIIFVTYHMTGK